MTTVNFGAAYGGKRVLVTGGLGFIGLNLVSHLLDLGAEVTVLDNFVPPSFETFRHRQRAQVKLAVADIRDADKVERVVRGKDVVFNLAGKSGAADSNKAPLLDLDINCRGHLTILEACREHNPHVSIVFPSSRLVYGKPHYLPVDEEHPLTPESIYAAHKVSVENYHLVYARLYGLTTSILRISNPYGPMQCVDERPYGIANRMIQTAVANKQITLFGEGAQRRDYLYIDDLIDALLRAGTRREGPPLVCNIGDSRAVSLRELAELAVHTAGAGEIVQVPWPKEYQAIETGDYQSCIERAREILGWEPVVALSEGVASTIVACRKAV